MKIWQRGDYNLVISYLHNKNIKIKNRGDYIIRRFIEKPRQNNRYRYTNFTEKRRRYVKPHPSTRYRKETNTAEKPKHRKKY